MERSLLRTDKEITQLYETYVDMVYRLCFTMLKNRFDTEDAVQNTFMKLMHHTKPFDSMEHEKAWLIVTASNTCKDTLRRASRREEPLELQGELPAPADADPDSGVVLDAVLALPMKYRVPVYLYYYEGCSVAEVAAALRANPSTVQTWLLRARARLRKELSNDGEGEESDYVRSTGLS